MSLEEHKSVSLSKVLTNTQALHHCILCHRTIVYTALSTAITSSATSECVLNQLANFQNSLMVYNRMNQSQN